MSPLYNRVVSAGGPDLFVVCKSCGSEVSPYITECPYCGNRLRKRAPKLDRNGRVAERRLRPPKPSLPRLRPNEIPGIRAETRPYATILLVLASVAGALVWRTNVVSIDQLAIIGKPGHDWWKLVTAAFTYNNAGLAFAVIGTIAIYGCLVERRHGPLAVIALFGVGAIGGLGVTVLVYPVPVALSGNGGALALLGAWATPHLAALARREAPDGDLIGTAVIAAVVLLMPLAAPEASWVAGGVGLALGLVLGVPFALANPE
jgi:membrane associated rhomboid family serine protease